MKSLLQIRKYDIFVNGTQEIMNTFQNTFLKFYLIQTILLKQIDHIPQLS